jgi:transcriptional regulator of acetoin/glycerol metabolism
MYADGKAAESVLAHEAPNGWQVVLGVDPETDVEMSVLTAEIVELPTADEIGDDLALLVAAWANQLAPGTAVAPSATERLSLLARESGFAALEDALIKAVAAADSRIEEEHVPVDGHGLGLVDELLRTDDPLAALEDRLLREVLERSSWRMQEAADRLGMSRVTLWRKLKDHGIERPECAG